MRAKNSKTGAVEKLIEDGLHCTWIVHDLEKDKRANIIKEVLDKYNKIRNSRRIKVSFQEIILVSGIVMIILGLGWVINRILPHTRQDKEPILQSTYVVPSTGLPMAITTDEERYQTNDSIPLTPTYLRYIVQPGDTLTSVAKQLGISVAKLNELNRIPASGTIIPGEVLIIRVNLLEPGKISTPLPLISKHSPLSDRTNEKFVEARILESRTHFNTFWGDAQIYYYGPNGYLGPPSAFRVQFWYASPGKTLGVIGFLQSDPEMVVLERPEEPVNGNDRFISFRNDSSNTWNYYNDRFSQVGETQAHFQEALSLLQKTFNFIPQHVCLHVEELDSLSGRDTIVVTLHDASGKLQAKIWVDTITGMILRWQQMTSVDHVIWEMIFTDVVFDHFFPGGIFEPFNFLPRYFSEIEKGVPQAADLTNHIPFMVPSQYNPLTLEPAPPGYNYMKKRLIFQYPANYNNQDSYASVSIFTEQYYLGDVHFGNPWTMICDRSLDGKKVAYVSEPGSDSKEGMLYWFSLDEPGMNLHTNQEAVSVNDLAFSPDSQNLAFIGKYHSRHALYILDIQSTKSEVLIEMASGRSLAWSKDGKYLAILMRENETDDREKILVIEISRDKHEVIFIQDYEEDELKFLDHFDEKWSGPFPVENRSLENCSKIPGK